MNSNGFNLIVSNYISIILFIANINLSYCMVKRRLPLINEKPIEPYTDNFNRYKDYVNRYADYENTYLYYIINHTNNDEDIYNKKLVVSDKDFINMNKEYTDEKIKEIKLNNRKIIDMLPKEGENCLHYWKNANNSLYFAVNNKTTTSDNGEFLENWKNKMLKVLKQVKNSCYQLSHHGGIPEWFTDICGDDPIQYETYESYMLRNIARGKIPLPKSMVFSIHNVPTHYFLSSSQYIEYTNSITLALFNIIFDGPITHSNLQSQTNLDN